MCRVCVVSTDALDCEDVGETAMSADALRSSLHVVRSWLKGHYYGHTRRSLKCLLGTCERTDTGTARLTDEDRSCPWD